MVSFACASAAALPRKFCRPLPLLLPISKPALRSSPTSLLANTLLRSFLLSPPNLPIEFFTICSKL